MRPGARWAIFLLVMLAGFAGSQGLDLPLGVHELADRLAPGEGWRGTPAPEDSQPIDARGLRVVIPFAHVLRYDEARDATLVGARFCSHEPCGPLLWIEGDLRTSPPRSPILLAPTTDTLRLERVAPEGSSFFARVDVAVAEPFEARPSAPGLALALLVHVAPLSAAAVLPDVDVRRRLAPALAPLLGAWAAYHAQLAGLGGLLFVFGLLVLGLVGAVALLVGLGVKRRLLPEPLALLVLAVAFFAAMDVMGAYFPAGGAGD